MSITLKKFENTSRYKKITFTITTIVVLMLSIVAYVNWDTSKEIPAINKEINSFLIYMSSEKYEDAYKLFSEKYKKEENFDAFKKSISQLGPLYIGYKADSLETTGFIKRFYLTTQEIHYEGQIIYSDTREIADIYAVYILEGGQWKLYGMEIYPPPTRYKNVTPIPR